MLFLNLLKICLAHNLTIEVSPVEISFSNPQKTDLINVSIYWAEHGGFVLMDKNFTRWDLYEEEHDLEVFFSKELSDSNIKEAKDSIMASIELSRKTASGIMVSFTTTSEAFNLLKSSMNIIKKIVGK